MTGRLQPHDWTTSVLVEHRDALFDSSVHRWVVGLSGGLDSSALLHFLANLPDRPPMQGLYVDHGLHSASADWANATRAQCEDLEIEHQVIKVKVGAEGSLETAAREARYEAFAGALRPGDLLLLGHHGDDQVETLLLNLFRGSDQFGRLGMPPARPLGVARLLRPLLGVSRDELTAYAAQNGIQWIEDPSNQDQVHDRNYLRRTVLPLLDQRFSNWRGRALIGARRDHSARSALAEQAELDLLGLASDLGIPVQGLSRLPHERQVQVLRTLIARSEAPQPSRQAIEVFLKQIKGARTDASAQLQLGSFAIRLDRCFLHVIQPEAEPLWQPGEWQVDERFRRRGHLILLKHRSLGGLRLPLDQFRLASLGRGQKIFKRQRLDIREQLRASGVPAWLRDRLPVLMDEGEVVMVPAMPPWFDVPLIADKCSVGPSVNGWALSVIQASRPT